MSTVASNKTGTVVGAAVALAKKGWTRYKQGMKTGYDDAASASFASLDKASKGEQGIMETLKSNYNINKNYMNAGSMADKTIKYGTVAGGYVGLNVGARYLRDGDVGRNPDGRPDIAGIPFI